MTGAVRLKAPFVGILIVGNAASTASTNKYTNKSAGYQRTASDVAERQTTKKPGKPGSLQLLRIV
jgi:hypothetical protein